MEEKARRDAFNMKVLKRQDPQIVDIVGSAAFVVLYELDGEWTKLGIEGPMFLYRRSSSPKYGFSVLNRNGIENYTANMTKDDDLELTEDFLIYRAHSDEQVLGIWIYDAQERTSIGQTMSKLHADTFSTASEPQVTSAMQSQAGQSISLDALFGPHAPAAKVQQPPTTALSGTDLLDSMFKSVAVAPTPPPAGYDNDGPGHTLSSASTSNGAIGSAADLKALLGLTSGSGADAASRNDNAKSTTSTQQLPQGLETLFASTRVHDQQPASGIAPATAKPTFVDLASGSLNDALSTHQTSSTVLDRRDFVREILSLIHVSNTHIRARKLVTYSIL
jgi:hypothetical protein